MANKFGKILILAPLLTMILSGYGQNNPTVCDVADLRLRHYFMDWRPGLAYDMDLINTLYAACPNPSARAGMVQSYFLVYRLLVENPEPGVEAADALYAAYRRFNDYAAQASEVTDKDPFFARKLLTRAESLETRYNALLASASRNSTPAPVGDLAAFPVPPADFSSAATLPAELTASGSMGESETRMRKALQAAGFERLHYFSAPSGFAVLTQLERMQPDGNSFPREGRFLTSVGFGDSFAIRSYRLGLALAEPGYYRAFALVISVPGTGASKGWEYSFGEELPPRLAMSKIPAGASATAFVFEFEVPKGSEPPRLLRSAGRGGKGLAPGNHLSLSGIWAKLVE